MDIDHRLNVGHLHLGERLVAQDAGVVDQDVDATEGFYRLFDHGLDLLVVGHVGTVGDGRATGLADFFDHSQGGVGRAAGAVAATAEVVDHHLGATGGQVQGVNAAQAVAGAGDDGNTVIEANGHGVFLLLLIIGGERRRKCVVSPESPFPIKVRRG
ncbi:hypothetical protein D3C78_1275310 [compost metagenome]